MQKFIAQFSQDNIPSRVFAAAASSIISCLHSSHFTLTTPEKHTRKRFCDIINGNFMCKQNSLEGTKLSLTHPPTQLNMKLLVVLKTLHVRNSSCVSFAHSTASKMFKLLRSAVAWASTTLTWNALEKIVVDLLMKNSRRSEIHMSLSILFTHAFTSIHRESLPTTEFV